MRLDKIDENTYRFFIKDTEFEVDFNEDGSVEIFELENPAGSGFIFKNINEFILFLNVSSDLIDLFRGK